MGTAEMLSSLANMGICTGIISNLCWSGSGTAETTSR